MLRTVSVLKKTARRPLNLLEDVREREKQTGPCVLAREVLALLLLTEEAVRPRTYGEVIFIVLEDSFYAASTGMKVPAALLILS